MATRSDHTIAPQVAALLLQFERALHHLSQAGHTESVAVEHVDDVSVHCGDRVTAQEQDKSSVRPGAELLGDRSTALWRTLQIWLGGYRERGHFCNRYFLVTNASAGGSIVEAIRANGPISNGSTSVVQALRAAGPTGRTGRKSSTATKATKIQALIDDVLSEQDHVLAGLATRIEIVDEYNAQAVRPEIANGFGIDPGVERDLVLESLLGWFIETLKEAWLNNEPGIVSREACLRQCRAIERRLQRCRLLPRPAADLTVAAADVTKARGRPFVDHLGRIEAPEEDVLQAIEHFIQFNTEKHRLAREGEIEVREWLNRGKRLKERWRSKRRHVALEYGHRSRIDRGQLILAHTTYDHRESLGGQSCDELYMTSGHYHRLADEDEVWWDPEYQRS